MYFDVGAKTVKAVTSFSQSKAHSSEHAFFFFCPSLVSLCDSVYVPVVSPPMLFHSYISLFVCLLSSVALRQSGVIKVKAAASTQIPLGNQPSFLFYFFLHL